MSGEPCQGKAAERVLLFGGSFDPPHIGHMNLLKNAIAAVAPDVVYVVPSGTAPHKAASTTPGDIRAAMCACFLPLFPQLVVSRMEIERPGKSYTVDTVAQLQTRHPGAAVYLVIGGDMLKSFTAWHRWQQLLGMATLVVTGRTPGEAPALESAAKALAKTGARVLFADGPVVPAASSDIRAGVAAGNAEVFALIPPPADEIVRQKALYKKQVAE